MANLVLGRSTKGASKQRRDLINNEIEALKDLLPLPETIRHRLFQLQVMSLACISIRRDRYMPHLLANRPVHPRFSPKRLDSTKALRGFLLLMTRQGKLLYISENAGDYLGYSVEEIMSQGDSFFDIVDTRDHSVLQSELLAGPPSMSNFPGEQRIFVCRMNLNRAAKRQPQYQKFVVIQGGYLHPAEYYQALLSVRGSSHFVQPLFAAFCSPLISPETADMLASGHPMIFSSVHNMDMKFLYIDDVGIYHLGCSRKEIIGQSWYTLLYPSDVFEASTKHRLLSEEKESACTLLLRIKSNTGWLWVHTVLAIRDGSNEQNMRQLITATYQTLSDLEVKTLGSAALSQRIPMGVYNNCGPTLYPDVIRSLYTEQPSMDIFHSNLKPVVCLPSAEEEPTSTYDLCGSNVQSIDCPTEYHNLDGRRKKSARLDPEFFQPQTLIKMEAQRLAAEPPYNPEYLHQQTEIPDLHAIQVHIPSHFGIRSLLTPDDSPISTKGRKTMLGQANQEVVNSSSYDERRDQQHLRTFNSFRNEQSMPVYCQKMNNSRLTGAPEHLPVIEADSLEAFFKTVEDVPADENPAFQKPKPANLNIDNRSHEASSIYQNAWFQSFKNTSHKVGLKPPMFGNRRKTVDETNLEVNASRFGRRKSTSDESELSTPPISENPFSFDFHSVTDNPLSLHPSTRRSSLHCYKTSGLLVSSRHSFDVASCWTAG